MLIPVLFLLAVSIGAALAQLRLRGRLRAEPWLAGIGLGVASLGGVFAIVMLMAGGYAILAGAAAVALFVGPGLGLWLGSRSARLTGGTARAAAFAAPASLAVALIAYERWGESRRWADVRAADARVETGTLGGVDVRVPVGPRVSLRVAAPSGEVPAFESISFNRSSGGEAAARLRLWCEERPGLQGTAWCGGGPPRLVLRARASPPSLFEPIGEIDMALSEPLGTDARGEAVRHACRRVNDATVSCDVLLAVADGVWAKADVAGPAEAMPGALRDAVATARQTWTILTAPPPD